MAGRTGLEPATSGLTGQRSNQLNYHPKERTVNSKKIKKKQQRIKFLKLCSAALILYLFPVFNGRRNRDRTCDLSLVRAALSQLSYPPKNYFYTL